MTRQRPDFMGHLRFRGDVRLGPAPDPERRRRVPPTASVEEQIADVVGWMIACGFDPDDARRRGEWYREYHRLTGTNLLALPPEELLAIVVEADRQQRGSDRVADRRDITPLTLMSKGGEIGTPLRAFRPLREGAAVLTVVADGGSVVSAELGYLGACDSDLT